MLNLGFCRFTFSGSDQYDCRDDTKW